jgi:hypothetical protein
MLTEGYPFLTRNRRIFPLFPLLGISILLSMVSVYTIYKGMTGFTGHAVIAVIIAIGVQSLLFLTAWRLGFSLRKRMPSVRGELIAFLVYFSLSTALSFVGLLDKVFPESQQEQASLARVHDRVAETIASAGNKVREHQRALIHQLPSSPEFTAWSGQIAAIADLAAESRERLTQVVAGSNERRRAQADRLEADAREVASSAKTLDRRLRVESAAVQRLDGLRQSLAKEIVRLKARLRETNDAVAKLQERPRDKERSRLIDQLEATNRLLTQKTDRLKTLEAEHQTLTLRMTRTRDELKAIGDRRAAIEGAVQEARRKLEVPGAIATLDLGQIIQSLREAPPAFVSTLDRAALDKKIELCNDLLGAMWTVPALVPRLNGLSCDPGPLLKPLEAIDTATSALGTLERDCLAGGKNARTIDTLSFSESLNYARGCLEATRLPADSIRAEHREINRLARDEAPGTPPFARAKIALLGGEWQAMLALFIAMGLNLLVLLAGFFGTLDIATGKERPVELILPTDPPPDRLFQAILVNARTTHHLIGGVQYDHLVRERDINDPGEREAVRQFLLNHIKVGLVLPHPREERVFLLREGMVSELFTRVADVQGDDQENLNILEPLPKTEPKRAAPSGREPVTGIGTHPNQAKESPSTVAASPSDAAHRSGETTQAVRSGVVPNVSESAETDRGLAFEDLASFTDLDRLLRSAAEFKHRSQRK